MMKIAAMGLVVVALAGAAQGAITVTNTNNAAVLQNALVGPGSGISVSSFSVLDQSGFGAQSTGTFVSGLPNGYNLGGQGVVLSTGNAGDYSSGPNTITNKTMNFAAGAQQGGAGVPATAAQNALLSPISGQANHFDVTQIDITFTPDPGVSTVGFDLVFGSEEFAEFVGSNFNDAFAIYLNGVNIAFYAGQPINIDHPAMANLAETELDGVIAATPTSAVFQVLGATLPGTNTLTFIIGDSADGAYDTTIYIKNLGIPTPGTAGLLAVAGLVAARRRRA